MLPAPPLHTDEALVTWWDGLRPGLTDEQANAIWDEFFDPIYTVAELPLEG